MEKTVTDVIDVNEAADDIALVGPDSPTATLRWPPRSRDATVFAVAVDRGPIGGMVVSADGRRLMVTNYGDDSLSVIDAGTGAVVRTVFGTQEPLAIATGQRAGESHAGRAYVGTVSAACDSILTIDMDTGDVVATHPVALSVGDLAVDPSGQRVYVARTAMSGVDVLVIDAAQGPIDAVDLSAMRGATTACIRVSPDGRRLYVAIQRPGGDVVMVLDPDLNLVDTIEIGSTIRDVAVSPDGGTVFVAVCDPDLGGVVDIVDTRANTVADRVEVGGLLTQLTVSRNGDRAYLVTADGVAVMCTRTHRIVGTITVSASPSCVVEGPDGSHLYIADYQGGLTAVAVPVASPSTSLPQRMLDDAIAALLELEPAV